MLASVSRLDSVGCLDARFPVPAASGSLFRRICTEVRRCLLGDQPVAGLMINELHNVLDAKGNAKLLVSELSGARVFIAANPAQVIFFLPVGQRWASRCKCEGILTAGLDFVLAAVRRVRVVVRV